MVKKWDLIKSLTDFKFAEKNEVLCELKTMILKVIGLEEGQVVNLRDESNVIALLGASMKLLEVARDFNRRQKLLMSDAAANSDAANAEPLKLPLIKEWSVVPEIDRTRTHMMPITYQVVYCISEYYTARFPEDADRHGLKHERYGITTDADLEGKLKFVKKFI